MSLNPNASCIVMTTEILRSMIYRCEKGGRERYACTRRWFMEQQPSREQWHPQPPIPMLSMLSNPCIWCVTLRVLRRGSELLREVAWVVFDEVHYMQVSRGAGACECSVGRGRLWGTVAWC